MMSRLSWVASPAGGRLIAVIGLTGGEWTGGNEHRDVPAELAFATPLLCRALGMRADRLIDAVQLGGLIAERTGADDLLLRRRKFLQVQADDAVQLEHPRELTARRGRRHVGQLQRSGITGGGGQRVNGGRTRPKITVSMSSPRGMGAKAGLGGISIGRGSSRRLQVNSPSTVAMSPCCAR